jgi:5-methylcytosine-specific restriction enzyme A
MKLCTVCGVATSRPGSRCTDHVRQSNRSRHNALYSTPTWQRLSARVLRAWRGEHGNWCPGYQRDAHPASDLTVDHVVPLAAGGAPFDIANCAVLFRPCNSTKGASTDRGGVAHTAAGTSPDRASWICARGDTQVDWSEAFELVPSLTVGYVWHAGVHAPEVASGLERIGFEVVAQVIWEKGLFAMGRSWHHWAHEPCWVVRRASARCHSSGSATSRRSGGHRLRR